MKAHLRHIFRAGICQAMAGQAATLTAPDLTATAADSNQITSKADPTGIDEELAYAPGTIVVDEVLRIATEQVSKLDAPLGADLCNGLAGTAAIEASRRVLAAMVDRVSAGTTATGESLLVQAIAPATLSDLSARGIDLEMESAGIWLRDRELLHSLRESKGVIDHALPAEVWRNLSSLLEGATPYLDALDQALVCVFDASKGTGKVVVRVNYSEKVRRDGKRERITANFARTGGLHCRQ